MKTAPLLALFMVLTAACDKTEPSAPAASAPPGSAPSPAASAPTAAPAPAPAAQTDTFPSSAGEIKITPRIHATLLVELDKAAVWIDPTKDVKPEGLPKADVVLITDIHPDHMDPAGLEKVMRADSVVVAPQAVADLLPKTLQHVVVMKNGDKKAADAISAKLGATFSLEAVPMYNKTRGPEAGKLFHDKGRGNGYVIGFGGKRLYVSGDTECIDEMKALQKIDVAFVCMNLPYTMPPSEAIACIDAFKPAVIYPYHYRGQNPEEVKTAMAGKPVDVRLREWYPK